MDNITQYFYHMSPQLYKEGDKIEGNGKDKIHAVIEEGLELFKPLDFLSRRNAVFTHSNTNFSETGLMDSGYIYQVELPKNVQKHDLAWITPLQLAQLKIKYNKIGMSKYPDWSDDLLKKCSNNYWNGIPSDKPNWEYLAPYMVITKKLSENIIEPKDTKGNWKPE